MPGGPWKRRRAMGFWLFSGLHGTPSSVTHAMGSACWSAVPPDANTVGAALSPRVGHPPVPPAQIDSSPETVNVSHDSCLAVARTSPGSRVVHAPTYRAEFSPAGCSPASPCLVTSLNSIPPEVVC